MPVGTAARACGARPGARAACGRALAQVAPTCGGKVTGLPSLQLKPDAEPVPAQDAPVVREPVEQQEPVAAGLLEVGLARAAPGLEALAGVADPHAHLVAAHGGLHRQLAVVRVA